MELPVAKTMLHPKPVAVCRAKVDATAELPKLPDVRAAVPYPDSYSLARSGLEVMTQLEVVYNFI